jgi:ATP phosphoribosyltransferase
MEGLKTNNMRRLRIGIPSVRSRLHAKVMNVLNLPPYDNPQRLVFYTNEVIVFFLRGWDLASIVEASRLDMAFCGIDTIEELSSNVVISKRFECMKSPIALCKRKDLDLEGRKHLVVATEYPNLTKRVLHDRFDKLEVIYVHGATEALAHLDNIDAIVDIVETGETLESNNLHLIEVLSYTYPCIIHNTNNQINLPSLRDITDSLANALFNNSPR